MLLRMPAEPLLQREVIRVEHLPETQQPMVGECWLVVVEAGKTQEEKYAVPLHEAQPLRPGMSVVLQKQPVFKKLLPSGLQVLVHPMATILHFSEKVI